MADVESLSDRLAITALVISLVALLIGLSSFLQAILGTAEGYRRCADSVIGPWSKLRRRVFRWTEFRYETKFRAPLIKLVTTDELVRAQQGEHAGTIYLLNEKKCDNNEKPAKVSEGIFFKKYNPGAVLQASLHLPEFKTSAVREHGAAITIERSYLIDDTLGDITRVSSKAEKGFHLHSTELDVSRKKNPSKARDTLLVSWIRLLRELHVLYLGYWPSEACSNGCGSLLSANDVQNTLALSLSTLSSQAYYGKQWDSSARTRIAVIMQEWTWDFMPSDVSRPLALSTVGHVVVLALRLGMRWRILDRTRLQMTADGNGASISSTDVRGLGLVLRFATFGHPSFEKLDIIPSRAADKLMCGILPGDADLVQQDFNLIGADRKLIQFWEPDSMYTHLGLDQAVIGMLRRQDRWTTHNEVVTLLCTFLPLPGSQSNTFFFPGWKTRQYTVFHFFETRLAFLRTLRESKPTSEVRVAILAALTNLSTGYTYEFLGTYAEGGPPSSASYPQRRLDLIEYCAKKFRATTKYFIDKGYNIRNDNIERTWYMQLVAAHARLSAHANEQRSQPPAYSQDQMPPHVVSMFKEEKVNSKYFSKHLWDQSIAYIEGIDNKSHGVVQYMTDRAFPGTASEITDAWWMLMLRGILWDMSCECLTYPGEPVISSYYHDETSIWFT